MTNLLMKPGIEFTEPLTIEEIKTVCAKAQVFADKFHLSSPWGVNEAALKIDILLAIIDQLLENKE